MAKLSVRIWILIIALLLSLLAISPTFSQGALIKSVERNSTSYTAGLRSGMLIESVNGIEVNDVKSYSDAVLEIFNEAGEKKLVINTDQGEFILLADSPLNITVRDNPRTKIKTGLDLQGGARALVQPEVDLNSQQINDLIEVTSNRLNVFGISDVSIRAVSDLSGNQYMLVEIAGATPSDIRDLVAKQGKFQAKIGNETVFTGGTKDIVDVCRFDATCSGIRSCNPLGDGTYGCQFSFAVYLSNEAAQRHADITSVLDINTSSSGRYLEKPLDLFVDDTLTDSLLISDGLKGLVTTEISVQGSGVGITQEEAFDDATSSMNQLQTIMITGSLPYKLNIVKLDSISPTLGGQFINYLWIAGLLSFLGVALFIFARYRNIKYTLAMLLTVFSEVFIILGVAALLGWNLDLASIAGILIVLGTGIDQQVIIVDESSKEKNSLSFKQKMKRAWFIIIGAYFTALASLLPLYWAGAGLLRGFAFTSILGITIGFLITRPAFADVLKGIEAA